MHEGVFKCICEDVLCLCENTCQCIQVSVYLCESLHASIRGSVTLCAVYVW